jgi:hypothetical protein
MVGLSTAAVSCGSQSVLSTMGIYHVHFNAVLTEITVFKFELTFLEMSKISKNSLLMLIPQ